MNLNGQWGERKGWPHFLIITKASLKINKHKKPEEMWEQHLRSDTGPAEEFRAKINVLTLTHLHGA